MRALVRAVSPSLAECQLTHLVRTSIDPERAAAQHVAYVAALADLGANLVWLPELPDHPDATFVEDVAVIAGQVAVLTRPGAESRQDEVASAAAALAGPGPVRALTAPARLDGGDVLRINATFYVGAGTRSDDEGRRQLAGLIASEGCSVVPVPVPGALHLKTAVTALPDGTLVADPSRVDLSAFGDRPLIEVDADEPDGANVLALGGVVLISAAAPRTARRVAEAGHAVRLVDISELHRAEAGLTCLSIIDHRRP